MDIEKQKRIRTLRVVLFDSLMVLAITVLVIILVLVVSGYRVKDGLVLEQAGLLQVISHPSGAQVKINGEKVGKTEFNRMLDDGVYHVALEKEGYEGWQKDVKIVPGWLARINYARLILQDRKAEMLQEFNELNFLSVSPDRNNILYSDNATNLKLMKINNDDVNVENIELKNSLLNLKQIEIESWSRNSERIIAKMSDGTKTQWVVINLKKPEESVNVSQKFNLEINKLTAANNSADKLLALSDDKLQEIDLKRNEVSEVLISNVASYDNEGAEIIYVSRPDEKNQRIVGYKNGNTDVVKIYTAEEPEKSVVAAISKYIGKSYLTFMVGDRLYIYEDDQTKLVAENDTGITPTKLSVSKTGEFIFGRNGKTVLMVDLELFDYNFYETTSEKMNWIDDYMLAEVTDGKLNVFDFDGANRRVLSAADEKYPATISENNKYIYYIYNNDNKLELRREAIER